MTAPLAAWAALLILLTVLAHVYLRGVVRVFLLRVKARRLIQPAGFGRRPGRDLTWHDGFAVRLPGHRLLLVTRRR